MNPAVLYQVPKGDDLALAVFELDEHDRAQCNKALIKRGLDVSIDANAPRTEHTDFMADLKAELMRRIDAR